MMEGKITINNAPEKTEKYVVVSDVEGEFWYWGSWPDDARAKKAANEIGGLVVKVGAA